MGTEGGWYGAQSIATRYGGGDGKHTQIWKIADCGMGSNNHTLKTIILSATGHLPRRMYWGKYDKYRQ
ncbi:MAG: hypothetical protein BroJett001_11320 [Chloroflexota bacterium]|nr:MAG: hypothetical protein BroJett001_11320 [Chloroflexota bacterium]GJQ37277.1 MAG: hypothetical protein JETCAE01_32870 [Anaerolineaceae bacterium]